MSVVTYPGGVTNLTVDLASALVIPGTTATDVLTLAIDRPGRYFVIWTVDADWTVANAGNFALTYIVTTGAGTIYNVSRAAFNICGSAQTRTLENQTNLAVFTGSGSIKLQASKNVASGTLQLEATHTALTAMWMGL